MKKKTWKSKIQKASVDAQTYQPYFESVIDTLAGIMEQRDIAQEKYELSGGNPVVAHTNKGGATNIVKNPALVLVMELNAQALSYWRELGLTPAGLKKINEDAMRGRKRNALADALKELG